jgi:hypothetical protein
MEAARAATRNWPWAAAKKRKAIAPTSAAPAERPFMLSRRLNALVIPTSQTIVRAESKSANPVGLAKTPDARATPAARVCTPKRAEVVRELASSSRPTSDRRTTATRRPPSARQAPVNQVLRTIPASIARPPKYGVAIRCDFPSRGRSRTLNRTASRRATGVPVKLTENAATDPTRNACSGFNLPAPCDWPELPRRLPI